MMRLEILVDARHNVVDSDFFINGEYDGSLNRKITLEDCVRFAREGYEIELNRR